jgi:hypothetical protein
MAWASAVDGFSPSARAGNRRFRSLSALRAHTKAPYKIDFHRKTLWALNRPGRARTVNVLKATVGPADLVDPVYAPAPRSPNPEPGPGGHYNEKIPYKACKSIDLDPEQGFGSRKSKAC